MQRLRPLSQLKTEAPNVSREILVVDTHTDETLRKYIEKAKSTFNAYPGNYQKIVEELGYLVSDNMGGKISSNPWNGYKLHINALKKEKNTNLLALGDIKQGTYYHRALLFKLLCDEIGIASDLTAGKHPRAWNVVYLPGTNSVSILLFLESN